METGRDSMLTQQPHAETNSKLKKSNSCEKVPEIKGGRGKQTTFENIDILRLT